MILNNSLTAAQKEYDELYQKCMDYEKTLREIENHKRSHLAEIAKKVLNKHHPHRSCPNCFEDCIGWVVDGEPCSR